MKKIMFNDKYGLTEAVLNGSKTQTRRICSIPQPPYERYIIAFPAFVDAPEKSPLNGAYCWFNRDNREERTAWIKPFYQEDEIVAIAQSYQNAGYKCSTCLPCATLGKSSFFLAGSSKGWSNKMFVSPALMPYRIKITKLSLHLLQNITDEDCIAEGIIKGKCGSADTHFMEAYYIPNDIQPYCTPKEAYAALIDKISGKGTWDSNPWVWAYTFQLIPKED